MNLKEYYRRLDKILETMDAPEMVRLFVKVEGVQPPREDVLLVSMHKTRVERRQMKPHLRLESIEWLRARGYARQNGLPLPPPGELPQ